MNDTITLVTSLSVLVANIIVLICVKSISNSNRALYERSLRASQEDQYDSKKISESSGSVFASVKNDSKNPAAAQPGKEDLIA